MLQYIYVRANVHNRTYRINETDLSVTWESYDFSSNVSGIPNEYIREVMLACGVMYVASATPKIRVSNLLELDLQGLSAAHESLCMEQKVNRCSVVEQLVIDSITDPALKTRFINSRYRMFSALCQLDDSNQEFATSRELLETRATSR